MFDTYSRSLINDFPEFEGLTANNVARALSSAYLSIIRHRINLSNADADRLTASQPYLRRLANVMIFHVVLDEERPPNERQAAAFIAAEAVALIADYIALGRAQAQSRNEVLRSAERHVRIEAALLYLYSQYDACAAGILQSSDPSDNADSTIIDLAMNWCFDRLERLCRLRLVPNIDADFPYEFARTSDIGLPQLQSDNIARLYVELGIAASEFANWLSGTNESLDSALGRVRLILDSLTPSANSAEPWLNTPLGHEYSDVFHLCVLLNLSMPSLGSRALHQIVPMPPNGNEDRYRRYLQNRAVGTASDQGRPVLWPSALEYVNQCLHGSLRHAVISMPTGSGKSFIGELAVSQAISDGWALYLAPTNALTEQIRGDLQTGLRSLDTEILAFIGDQEYSIYGSDNISAMRENSVAVMTPEKCALALRLSPEAFENCRLVVFDECHLIGEISSARGPIAEIVLSQLMLRATSCRFLLMSAIVQNPDELAAWLGESLNEPSGAVTIRWRPTRTLRSILGITWESFQREQRVALEDLAQAPPTRKNWPFWAQASIAASLQGAWQTREAADYFVTNLDCNVSLLARRDETNDGSWEYTWKPNSWVNSTAISLATKLADQRIQTLVFTPASRHYPFSNGNKVNLHQDTLDAASQMPKIVGVCRQLAEFELGCESHVFQLLEKGVAVHTALMLSTEKIASETAFRNRSAPVMFATGTLAQGLNLPAVAVIIAGSRIGDPRGEDYETIQRRRFSQLLNAAGRAGRAGFANQGIVIAIPDQPIVFQNFGNVLEARDQADYLQQSDDSVRVDSGLTSFLDSICSGTLASESASESELEIVALLAGGDEHQLSAQPVLQRTFAAYRRRQRSLPDVTTSDTAILDELRDTFLRESDAPEWLAIAAQRAGLSFSLMQGIYHSWQRIRPGLSIEHSDWSIVDWLAEYIELLTYIPPGLLSHHLSETRLQKVSSEFGSLISRQRELLFETDMDWSPSSHWIEAWQTVRQPLNAWMRGDTLIDIASILSGDPPETITSARTQGKPLTKALALTGDTFSALSLIAGGFLAVAEQVLGSRVPLELASLPMAIKYGCDSNGVLGWFRFGVRLRRPAHLMNIMFPPPEFADDEGLRSWILEKRRTWLQVEDPAEGQVVEAIREFLLN